MDDDEIDDATFWKIELQKVQRLIDDTPGAEPEEDGENLFAVEFKATGPNMNADLEVLVSDIADEGQVVIQALDALQDGLETWARVLGQRKGAERVEPTGG